MRFLGVLGFRRIFSRGAGYEAVAIFFCDHLAHACYRFWRHVDAVGSHVGDVAALLALLDQALYGDAHLVHEGAIGAFFAGGSLFGGGGGDCADAGCCNLFMPF